MKRHTVMLVMLLAALAVIVSACGPTVPEPTEGTNMFVVPLGDDRAELQIEAPNGALPCGLAEVQWGQRVFVVTDFPACQAAMPDLAVYCLTGEAEWSADTVSNLQINQATNTVFFESRQDGICALVPTAAAQ